MIYDFLFPTKSNTTKVSLLLLAVRIIFGILLMNHGIQKWSNFQEMSAVFPDPLGIGSPLSLGLAIHRIPVSLGNDPDDFHNDSSLLCCSC